ncbi:MAG: MoaD/ThiS family protein [Lentisphaeraceae bacterium]|nr:MoaD/ThiS family protein [Lentisphaeraceae bacterium]
MARVEFTSLLKQFFPNLKSMEIEAENLAELVLKLNQTYPGISTYICDEQGALRHHVNIFINNCMLTDRQSLSDCLQPSDTVNIIQALSGG